jgi:hypothetical protein
MKARDVYRKAEEFGITPEAALNMRIRYLKGRIQMFMACEEEPELTTFWALRNIYEAVDMARHMRKEKEIRDNEITPAMIDRAKSTPIETIVDFKRGKCRCINPAHDDNNPSMYHGTRTNTAQCPACGYKADSIEAYRVLYGVDFMTAVKNLQR